MSDGEVFEKHRAGHRHRAGAADEIYYGVIDGVAEETTACTG